MDEDGLIGTLKAMKWEEAKGALRSLAALDGSRQATLSTTMTPRRERFEEVGEAVETFIKDFEDNGWHE